MTTDNSLRVRPQSTFWKHPPFRACALGKVAITTAVILPTPVAHGQAPPSSSAPPSAAALAGTETPRHRTRPSVLWFGVNGGWLFPFGEACRAQTELAAVGMEYDIPESTESKSWSEMAGAGPALEIDLGWRVTRALVLYGLWQHAWLSPGGDPGVAWLTVSPAANYLLLTSPPKSASARTDFVGIGLLDSSNPDGIGVLGDAALGYRWSHESWQYGDSDVRTLDLQALGEVRVALGAGFRIFDSSTFSAKLAGSAGYFNWRSYGYPGRSSFDFALDRTTLEPHLATRDPGAPDSPYVTLSLMLGVHYDLPLWPSVD